MKASFIKTYVEFKKEYGDFVRWALYQSYNERNENWDLKQAKEFKKRGLDKYFNNE